MMQKIKFIISANKFNENLSLQFFYLVVLSRFLMSYSYFMLNCKSLRILNYYHFGQKVLDFRADGPQNTAQIQD